MKTPLTGVLIVDLFDLHSDTLTKCAEKGEPLFDGNLDFNLKKAQIFKKRCQTMAAFIPDSLRGEKATAYYKKLRNCLYSELELNKSIACLCQDGSDILNAASKNKQAVIFSVESAAALGGKIENVKALYDDGVRIMSLTWNGENELACGVKGKGGITDLGKSVVGEMQRLGITVDVSHLNDRGFDELYDMGISPIIATHSNLRSVKNHPRNLTENQFKKIVSTGGVVGINFYTEFLGDSPFEYAFRHIYRMLCLGGENTVAIGSDFDGADFDRRLNSVEKITKLAEYLLSNGLSDDTVNKIMFNNALRVLGE